MWLPLLYLMLHGTIILMFYDLFKLLECWIKHTYTQFWFTQTDLCISCSVILENSRNMSRHVSWEKVAIPFKICRMEYTNYWSKSLQLCCISQVLYRPQTFQDLFTKFRNICQMARNKSTIQVMDINALLASLVVSVMYVLNCHFNVLLQAKIHLSNLLRNAILDCWVWLGLLRECV